MKKTFFSIFLAQESGGSPCPSSCPDLNKSQTLSSLSESGAVLVEVCCLLVLAVDNKVLFCICGCVYNILVSLVYYTGENQAF